MFGLIESYLYKFFKTNGVFQHFSKMFRNINLTTFIDVNYCISFKKTVKITLIFVHKLLQNNKLHKHNNNVHKL